MNQLPKENIALITGAGAVENAWEPVIRVLQTFHPNGFQLDRESAISLLTNIVYLRKYFERTKNDKAEIFYQNIKSQICASLVEAEKNCELKARPELIQIINEFVVKPTANLLHITANWDSTLDNAINDAEYLNSFKFQERISGIYLHGRVTAPESLYLPSEISYEPYRSETQSKKYEVDHANAGFQLSDCDRVIVYGLGLDPLDAELVDVLTLGLVQSERLKEIIIVNPDFDLVCKRIRVHFIGVKQPKITRFVPR